MGLVFALQMVLFLGPALGFVVWTRSCAAKERVPGWIESPRHPSGVVGAWNARILTGSVPAYGRLTLVGDTLSFLPGGTVAPLWSVPCASLVARKQGGGLLTGTPVRLEGPMGALECTVSVERIDRLSRNILKALRQQRYAEEFVQALWAHGARPA